MQLNTLLICQAALATLAQGATFHEQAIELMEEFPLLDTHIDLPQILRSLSI